MIFCGLRYFNGERERERERERVLTSGDGGSEFLEPSFLLGGFFIFVFPLGCFMLEMEKL